MKITPLEIQQQRFRIRFKGFDIREVDEYLDNIAEELSSTESKCERLEEENRRLVQENRDYREREETFKRALVSSQKVMEQMKENARKSAEHIISNAEVKAEKILNRAHNRLAQLHEDIAELKRQRIQLETQIRAVLETHTKLLDAQKEETATVDEEESRLKFLHQSKQLNR
jgi:cell division initiation protein